jgi:ubiquinone/menaquinone biosynthesis C-methylase UbiE
MRSIWDRLGIELGSRVLDVGFGGFEELDYISKLVGRNGTVTGVEIKKSPTKKALTRLNPSKGIKVLTSHSSRIPLLDESFDIIAFKGVLHETENIPQSLREASRPCHENGRVMILDFSTFPKSWLTRSNRRWRICHPWNLFSPSLDKHPGFTREEVLALLETGGLQIQRYEENFAPGRFSGHSVPMFLAVAKKLVSQTSRV